MNGKQISDDEFLHTVNVSFAVLADSVKTTKFQMLSLFPDKKVAALCALNLLIIWILIWSYSSNICFFYVLFSFVSDFIGKF